MVMLGIISSKTKSDCSSTILMSHQIALDDLEVMIMAFISTIGSRKMASGCLLCYSMLDMKGQKLLP